MTHPTLKIVTALALWILWLAGCGRAPADPGDDGWPPSQGKSEPPPGTDSKIPGHSTVGSMVTGTVIEKLKGERTSTSIVMTGGLVHTTYWRCTVPCYQCSVPLPNPPPPCSGHRYASGLPDEVVFLAESIHGDSGMGTSLWLAADGSPRASSSGLSDVVISGRGSGAVWSTSKIPGGYYTSYPRTWAGLDKDGQAQVAWISAGSLKQVELWHAAQTAKGWQATKKMDAYPDVVPAIDRQGRVHLAHSTIIDPAAPTNTSQVMLYMSPDQKPWTVASSTKHSMQVKALELDPAGGAHLLYLRRKRVSVAQWEPLEVWYATNASGLWKHSLLNSGNLYPGYFTPAQLALALDAQGQVHVALNGSSWSGHKSNPEVSTPLVAGVLRDGKWRFAQVDDQTTGALDLAAHKGQVFVSYFGKEDFRVARVMIY